MVNVTEALRIGQEHRQAGRLAEAAKVYQQVLQTDPNNAHALHRLGELATRAGRYQGAAKLIHKAIAADARQAMFHVSLGEAYYHGGNLEAAVAAHRQALDVDPNLGLAHTHLGIISHSRGDVAEAEACFRRACAISPGSAQSHSNLGRVLYDQRRLAEAEVSFRETLRLAPQNARGNFNLAAVLHEQGRLDEAAGHYRRALEINENDVDAHNNLGMLLAARGALGEAEAHYRRAVQINPKAATALSNLAVVLGDQGHHAEAATWCRKAIEVAPDFAPVHSNLARSLQSLGQIDEAIDATRRAVELDPKVAGAYCNLGMCQQDRGQVNEAIASYRAGLAIDPADWKQHANLLYALNYLGTLDPQTVFDEHRQWARQHADPLTATAATHTNDRTPQRRLRIGYVSAHFRAHAVAAFAEPMLAAHDHERFEVFCYSNFALGDTTTQRFLAAADHWRQISAASDKDASKMIRRDEIDILVDLDGHIGGNRLLVFARKPAPIQVTYLGYQNTTGMTAMDYRLTDAHADPPGMSERYYTEALVRLPRSFFCYRPDPSAPGTSALPAEQRGSVTFGSFNQFAKVTPEVLATWAELLLAVEGSRLVLLAHATPWLERYVADTVERHGVEAARVGLTRRRPHQQYLELVSQVDVALDPFPFNGHTTTCDCLWQGVPVVTLAGRTYASRFGSSAHVNLELDELIADSTSRYVEVAARLARDRRRLAELRAGLRSRMLASPLVDSDGFTRNLEAAYREMWAKWCRGS